VSIGENLIKNKQLQLVIIIFRIGMAIVMVGVKDFSQPWHAYPKRCKGEELNSALGNIDHPSTIHHSSEEQGGTHGKFNQ
jgi:hypothetical protein